MSYLKNGLLLILSGFLLSCNEDGGGECGIPEQNRFVHELLMDKYLWYKDLPQSVNYRNFDSPELTLDFLKDEKDRFSYIADAQEYKSLFNQGQVVRYGFSFFIGEDDTVQIKYAFNNSPAGKAQLERGDKILSINGQTVSDIIASLSGWTDVFGPNEEGYPAVLQVLKKSGVTESIHMQKALVNINTVLHHRVIQNGSDVVGYLVFKSFLETSRAELEAVFSDFKNAGVNKIILDLRYNGGGRVSVAQYLASLMMLSNGNSNVFALLQYNDKNQHLNHQFLFESVTNEVDIEHVTVITTGATASASEMVINGLKPFVDVQTVGSTSYGKPVGMNGVEFCDNVILPITFSGVNHNGEGDYYEGIPADCAAEDDLNYSFGDTGDPMLSEALVVSESNACSEPQQAKKGKAAKVSAGSYSLQDIIGAY